MVQYLLSNLPKAFYLILITLNNCVEMNWNIENNQIKLYIWKLFRISEHPITSHIMRKNK